MVVKNRSWMTKFFSLCGSVLATTFFIIYVIGGGVFMAFDSSNFGMFLIFVGGAWGFFKGWREPGEWYYKNMNGQQVTRLKQQPDYVEPSFSFKDRYCSALWIGIMGGVLFGGIGMIVNLFI